MLRRTVQAASALILFGACVCGAFSRGAEPKSGVASPPDKNALAKPAETPKKGATRSIPPMPGAKSSHSPVPPGGKPDVKPVVPRPNPKPVVPAPGHGPKPVVPAPGHGPKPVVPPPGPGPKPVIPAPGHDPRPGFPPPGPGPKPVIPAPGHGPRPGFPPPGPGPKPPKKPVVFMPVDKLPNAEELASRLTLVEFTDLSDPKRFRSLALIEEMKRKNYPIVTVERKDRESAKLFREFRVHEIPTYVLLLDGEEFGRVVVREQTALEIRSELLTLFQRGRIELQRPKKRPRPRRPLFGLIFKSKNDPVAPTIRAQAVEVGSQAPSESSAQPLPDDRIQELSDVIGRARLERAISSVRVSSEDGAVSSTGIGTTIHYNEEFKEALFLVSARLFDGVDPFSARATVRVYSPSDSKYEDAIGQCVYCDAPTGLALVAARVSAPARPVAFLPKQASTRVGEDVYEFARQDDQLVSSKREAVAVDQRRFYAKEGTDAKNSMATYHQLSGESLGDGACCFVARNGRFYFAGLSVQFDEMKALAVVPTPSVEQALLTNRNLSAVYRDQLTGKFDAPASQEEIQFALNVLNDPEGLRPEYAIAQEAEIEYAAGNVVVAGEEKNEAELTPSAVATQELTDEAFAQSGSASTVASSAVPAIETKPVDSKDSLVASPSTISASTDSVDSGFASSVADFVGSGALDAQNEPRRANASELDSAEFERLNRELLAQEEAARAQLAQARPSQEQAIYAQEPLEQTTQSLTPTPAIETTPQFVPPTTEAETIPQFGAPTTEAETIPQFGAPTAEAETIPQFGAPTTSETIPQFDAPTTSETIPQFGAPTAITETIPQYVAPTIQASAPLIVTAQTPDGQTVQYLLNPAQVAGAQTSQAFYAPGASRSDAGAVSQTAYSADGAALAEFRREEEEFNAALEKLRQFALDGAEIVCIVNSKSTDPTAPKESEVIRLPKRTIAARRNFSTNVGLAAATPQPVQAPLPSATSTSIVDNTPSSTQTVRPIAPVPTGLTPVQGASVPFTAALPTGTTLR